MDARDWNFEAIDQAWDAFYRNGLGNRIMQAEEYHNMRLAFLTGAMCGINLVGIRMAKINKDAPDMNTNLQLTLAIKKTVDDIVKQTIQEANALGLGDKNGDNSK